MGLVCLVCILHSNERNATDFHRELSRLPHLSVRSYAFGTATLRNLSCALARARPIANLRQPNDARCCGL
jgi:hypothetical protein